jgi:hypothetical protein
MYCFPHLFLSEGLLGAVLCPCDLEFFFSPHGSTGSPEIHDDIKTEYVRIFLKKMTQTESQKLTD